jgi:hypothetical protein
MIAQIIDRYSEKAPAALMFRGLFARLFSDDVLDKIFAENREKQVESPVLLSYLVGLLVPVISGGRASLNAAYQASPCDVSLQAVYGKLRGVETQVSSALVRSTVKELIRIQDKLKLQKKDVIPGYHTYVIDGKTYNATEHRLLESRADSRCPLPGRSVAVLDTRYELFVDIECEANAHRCERKILTPLFDRVQEGELYLADRNFSDGETIANFLERKAYFVIRQHGACPAWREISGEKRIQQSCDGTIGGKVFDQKIEVSLPDGTWVRLRRVTIELKSPTRDGDRTLHFLTNLPVSVSPAKICTAYRSRWKIETCLGYLAQSLNAEIRTLCYPGAASLCFCLALLLFNMMSTLKSLLESKGKQPDPLKPIQLSYYYMAHEISECHAGLSITFQENHWKRYANMKFTEFIRWLSSIAANTDLKRYRKHTRGPKKPKPKRKFTGARHTATQKLLDAR